MELIPAKTIITKNRDTSWFGSDYNMNLYRGCSHGCIYCDSRSSCYRVDDFEQIKAKENALQIVRDDLRRKVKRHSLELIAAFGFGVSMLTKSTGILRDIPIYQIIAEQAPVNCMLTITTCEDSLSKKLEPGAPPSSERFAAVRNLSAAGLFAGVVMTPVLPFLEDTKENVMGMVELAREAGARFIYPMFGVTLRDRQREYFYSRLDRIFPDMGLRERYEKQYGERYVCSSPKAGSLYRLLGEECSKAGILYKMPDIIHSYKKNYQYEQLTLF